ncbi:hypothetical protein D9X30_5967 [Cupriavidus sp. U2]|nr:hypothetical protein D9X30_5967 [Cupriavidus sp. U2]
MRPTQARATLPGFGMAWACLNERRGRKMRQEDGRHEAGSGRGKARVPRTG